jgi:hypothetical protein
MTPFERLYAVAAGLGDVYARARVIIGTETLALALAKFAFERYFARDQPDGCIPGISLPFHSVHCRCSMFFAPVAAPSGNVRTH